MMSTPVLSKQQQKHTLSAKKTPSKGLRNVLAQPQDSYWPVATADKCVMLEELLKKLMPAVKRVSHIIPWSQLRHMKRDERAQAKKEAFLKQDHVPNTEIANSVIMGLNAITRSLEKNTVCCILVDANIEPQLLIRHIIMMAQNKKVPILLLPNLKANTLSTIGFASAACALKNTVRESSNHHFHPLYMEVNDIYKDTSPPKNSLQLFKDTEADETMLYKENEISIETESHSNSSEAIKFRLSTNVYKYRSSRKERAFVPPGATVCSAGEPIAEKTEDEFISITNYDSDEFDASIKKHSRYINIHKKKFTGKPKDHSKVNRKAAGVTYLPLKVKRLQGNSNRVKATKMLKQKKKF